MAASDVEYSIDNAIETVFNKLNSIFSLKEGKKDFTVEICLFVAHAGCPFHCYAL